MKAVMFSLALVVAVGCGTTPQGINQTSKVKVGTPIWEFETGGGVDSSPAIGSDGTVYVGSFDSKVYAIKTDSKGLAKSPWPMRGQNARHTGRISANPVTVGTVPPQLFVNTLGMKFVPVPGTEVAFSIWETRVKDYTAYAATNAGVDESWKNVGIDGFNQLDTHPVVNVSFKDAKAFCEWLTKKELAEGKLKLGQRYRLPADAEWSVAVGLGKEMGFRPKEKNFGYKGIYPWGIQMPTPTGAGNYAESVLVDNFQYTSPVGSFTANTHGIHDLGGNVWEWCEDQYDLFASGRVFRGASWRDNDVDYLLSSARLFADPDNVFYNYLGFRCVLTGEAGATIQPPEPEPAKPGTVSTLGEDVATVRALKAKGNANRGKVLFTTQACIACHTTDDGQTPKGPHLVNIGKRYKQHEILQAILNPSAVITQGFDTYSFVMKDNKLHVGFVTMETADTISIRTAVGVALNLSAREIKTRDKLAISSMPPGLVANLTPKQLADLLAYLQSLKSK